MKYYSETIDEMSNEPSIDKHHPDTHIMLNKEEALVLYNYFKYSYVSADSPTHSILKALGDFSSGE